MRVTCRWCDTPHAQPVDGGRQMSVDQVLVAVAVADSDIETEGDPVMRPLEKPHRKAGPSFLRMPGDEDHQVGQGPLKGAGGTLEVGRDPGVLQDLRVTLHTFEVLSRGPNGRSQ